MTNEYDEEEIRGLVKRNSVVIASGYTTIVSGPISGEIKSICNIRFANTEGSGEDRTVYIGVLSSGAVTPTQLDAVRVAGNDTDRVGNEDIQNPWYELEVSEHLQARADKSGTVIASTQWWPL